MEQPVVFFLCLIVGLVFGGAVVWLLLRSEVQQAYARAHTEDEAGMAALEERVAAREQTIEELRAENARLSVELKKETEARAGLDAKVAAFDEAQSKLKDAFQALSAEALQSNNQAFLDLARTSLERFHQGASSDLETRQQAVSAVVKPLEQALAQVDAKLRELEVSREGAYAGLTEQVRSLAAAQSQLQSETAKLVTALRAPAARGRWGELHLRRVVEMAGMVEHCDFVEQETLASGRGKLRPDMIVRLPSRRQVVVDAKTPLAAYLEALETGDETARAAKLKDHAQQVRRHIEGLAEKAYWQELPQAPEFVVCFLPGEPFFSAALEQDPELIEYGVARKVILATPTTLIALLKAVAYGWRQEKVAENAEAIRELGKTLYDRLRTLTGHFAATGQSLDRAVASYNRAAGMFENRVLLSARRFTALGAAEGAEIETLPVVETLARRLDASAANGDREGIPLPLHG